MHVVDAAATTYSLQLNTSSDTSSCPVMSSSHPLRVPSRSASKPNPPELQSKPSILSNLNPLNYMPSLSNRPEHSEQTINLPLQRETSSIPRGDAESNWEYPSPQQMYNAMLRKGYTDTPVQHVESMVAVHNFLNEGAWDEIVEWERIFSKGLGHGWERCKNGEEGLARERARQAFIRQRKEAMGLQPSASASTSSVDEYKPKLLRFMGRPNEPTPKSQILGMVGRFFPETYSSERPFDRHDWYIARRTPNGQQREIRYVIDYYAGGAQESGEPVFYLDIRPALDSPTAAAERAIRWGGDVWYRASGASARQQISK